jgi:hypothetical protein
MQFCEWLRHQHASDELFLLNILWISELCFVLVGAVQRPQIYLWAWDNHQAVCELEYQVRFSVGVCDGIVVDPGLLPDRLD